MSNIQLVMAIAVIAAVTFSTRAIPFILFGKENKGGNADSPAPIILFVGKYLPPALISAIIVYCYKDVDFLTGTHGIPELVSALLVICLQLRLKNTMLSIFTGTIFYMVVLRLV